MLEPTIPPPMMITSADFKKPPGGDVKIPSLHINLKRQKLARLLDDHVDHAGLDPGACTQRQRGLFASLQTGVVELSFQPRKHGAEGEIGYARCSVRDCYGLGLTGLQRDRL